MKTRNNNTGTLMVMGLLGAAGMVWGCSRANSPTVFTTVPPTTNTPAASTNKTTAATPATAQAGTPSEAAELVPGKALARKTTNPLLGGYPDPLALEAETPGHPTNRTVARRDATAAVNMYGETPGTATSATRETLLLDGMESLSQATFAGEGGAFDPCVSRDGKFLVFSSTQHRPTADIYIKSVNGRTVTQLTADPAQDVMPAISPDGQRVAFASNRAGSWDIYVMSINGGQAVQVTSDRTHELHATWSPDGNKIVFCRLGEVSGRWEMWVTDVNQPAMSEFIGYGLFPTWCPVNGTGENGRDKIVFQRSRERGDRAFSVWTIDYKLGDASSPTEIASSPTCAMINPTWSPDGQRIVFAVVPNPGEATGESIRPAMADLWMTDVYGGGRVNLTAGRFVNLMPSWGADGRIYFVSDRGGVDNVWSIGTEKAILAATGKPPESNTATATAQEGEHEAKH